MNKGYSTYLPVLLTFFLLSFTIRTTAQKVFDFNTACKQAYNEIIQLKLVNGQRLLDAEKAQHPENLIPYFLENYIDFFELFFNEDQAEYKKRMDNLDKRLDLMNKGPESSPFYLYTKAVIHFQWASLQVKLGSNWDAGWGFRRSFLQVKNNLDEFPDFSPNLLYNGAMQVAAGTIPGGYKWLSSLLGIKGSIKKGMTQLENFLYRTDEWAKLFHREAVFYYCYLRYHIQNDKEGVARFINEQQLDLVNNHLLAYLAANLNLNYQRADIAVKIIEGRNRSADYLSMPVWDMEMGYARLHHLEPDAHIYFERFIERFKGKFYVKDVLQKLSWQYYLLGDTEKAAYYRNLVLKRGSLVTEADKQAQKEAGTTRWPDKLLLQARLLSDGGYYRDALRLLHGKSENDFSTVEDKLEFSYRAGRIYDDLDADDEAIQYYRRTILIGQKRKEYYAARAALQTGFIYEQRGDLTAAQNWFQKCIDMKDHDYKNSLDQKAKAGIARCKGD